MATIAVLHRPSAYRKPLWIFPSDSVVYDGEAHEFGPQWTDFMKRTVEFFRSHPDRE